MNDEQVKALVRAMGLPVELCTEQVLSLRKALQKRQEALHLEKLDRSACLPWLIIPRHGGGGNAQ